MYTLHVDVLVNNPATKLHIRSQVGHLAHCATINIFFGHPPFAARGGWNYVLSQFGLWILKEKSFFGDV